MKKKNTMPERDWQQTHEKIRRRELRKRILVMGLTVAMVAYTAVRLLAYLELIQR